MKISPVLMLLGALAPVSAAHAATTFFVSTSGNDANTGSQSKPWRTVQKACNSATAGSTVQVATGNYNEKLTMNVQGSAAGGYITFQGAPGAIINGTGKTGQNLLTITNKSYLKIIGFEFANNLKVADGSAIRLEGSGDHIELRRNRIHDVKGTDAMGITVYGTHSTKPFSNLMIEGNEIYDCQPAPSEALTLNGNVNGFQIVGNHVHDVNNIAIDMIGGEGICPNAANDAARNGRVHLNKVDRARSSYGGGYGAGIYVDGGRDILIERNLVLRSDLGMEIGCENKGKVTSGITVRNNILINNDKAGLVFGGYDASAGRVKNCQFLNNTLFRNDTLKTGNGELWIQFASGNIVKNNVFVSSPGSRLMTVVADGVSNTLDYNLWFASDNKPVFNWKDVAYSTFAAYKTATKQDGKSVYGDPKFNLATTIDFRFKSDSPGLNAGDPAFAPAVGEADYRGGPRVIGGRVDPGAYESEFKAAVVSGSFNED